MMPSISTTPFPSADNFDEQPSLCESLAADYADAIHELWDGVR